MATKKLKDISELVFLGNTTVSDAQLDKLQKYMSTFNRLPIALERREDFYKRCVVLSDAYGYANPSGLRRDYGKIIAPGEIVCQVRDASSNHADAIKVAGTYVLRENGLVRLKPKKGIERCLKFCGL
ncbi:MAG: hypothetical protein AABW82_01065 [Nanoarchaeota archaeon]